MYPTKIAGRLLAGAFASALFALAGAAQAQTQAQVGTPSDGSSYTIQLYPGPTLTHVVELPTTVTTGDVVLLESGSDQSMSNWGGLLDFSNSTDTPPVGLATFTTDSTTFGSYPLTPSAVTYLDIDPNSDFTSYTAGNATYDIHITAAAVGGGPAGVPEPSSLAAIGVGAVALLAFARRSRRSPQ